MRYLKALQFLPLKAVVSDQNHDMHLRIVDQSFFIFFFKKQS